MHELDMLRMSGLINLSQIEEVKIFANLPEKDVRFFISRCRLISRAVPDKVSVVTFVRLEGPNRVRRGEFFRLRPVFMLNQPLYPDHKLFVHLYRQHDLAGRVGTDIPLSPAIRFWPLNTEVAVDSSPLMISPVAPPGEYIVQAGLYTVVMPTGEPYVKLADWEQYDGEKIVPHIQQPDTPLDYIKLPYTNTDIKEWEVGRITVE